MPTITLNIEHPLTQQEIEVEIEFEVSDAEPDVGIMSWGIEDETIVGEHTELNKHMTERQWDQIRERIYNDWEPDYGGPDDDRE